MSILRHSSQQGFGQTAPETPTLVMRAGFKLWPAIWYEKLLVEKIEPQQDHERLKDFRPGRQVEFLGKRYVIQRRTTLASGEAAVVLQSETEQFVVSASAFLAGVKSID